MLNPSVYQLTFCCFCFRSMEVNHQQSDSPNQGSGDLQHALEGAASFGFSNMHDMNQQVLSLDAIETSRLDVYEAYNERSDDVEEVTVRREEKPPVMYRRTRWKMNKEKQPVVYSRMKWTDEMVKLLITAVSYIGEDVWSNGIFPKKGKWRAISNAMAERGHHVSPQQCEDKFNDLNKKFKRLNDILGRGTACCVVENPGLMEMMDLTHDAQEEVKKLLSSKQLFYQELCSYNNQNRLFLPDDRELQRSVLLALKRKDRYEPEYVVQDMSAKRKIVGEERVSNVVCAFINSDCNVLNPNSNGIHDYTNNEEAETLQNEQQIMHQLLQLEEQKLQIKAQILELEKQRVKCLRFRRREDRELQELKLENKAMMLENKRMELQLKRCETSLQTE
ncbi:uncharacterized protein LOC107825526 isoform X1 [Nicotiana tabacum]